MIQKYIIEDGTYGKKLIPIAECTPSITKAVDQYHIKELELNRAKGWKRTSLNFLNDLSHLKSLTIIDFNITEIQPIHSLESLQYLDINTYCKNPIDFSCFPDLEECVLVWRARAKSLFECKKLRRLFLSKYTGQDLSKFSNLHTLKDLSIVTSRIKSVEGIENLQNLTSLGLYELRGLHSLVGIETLHNLKKFDIRGCRLIETLEGVRGLSKLEKIDFSTNAKIESLAPLQALKNLQQVLFYESTNIQDGNLVPLINLPNLKTFSFQNRKHYSHSREEIHDIIQERQNLIQSTTKNPTTNLTHPSNL